MHGLIIITIHLLCQRKQPNTKNRFRNETVKRLVYMGCNKCPNGSIPEIIYYMTKTN